MEFGDSGSMASTNKWYANAISLDLPVDARVISRQGADWILYVEKKMNVDDKKAYFRLTPDSKYVGEKKRDIKLRDTIKVLEAEQIELDEEAKQVSCNYAPHRRVVSYEILGEQKASFCEIVAVAEATEQHLVVVGTSFSSTKAGVYFRHPDDEKFKVGQFLMATCYSAEPGVRCFQKEHPSTKEKYFFYSQMYGNNAEKSESIHLPGEVRTLTEQEMEWIKTRLRTKEEITMDEALIYIRDPHIAAHSLEKYHEYSAALEVTLELLAHRIFVQRDTCILQFVLSAEEFEQCVLSQSLYPWRTSSDLTVHHEELKSGDRMETAFVRYNNAIVQEDGKYVVELVTEPRSKDLMRFVLNHHRVFSDKLWRIGPLCDTSDNVVTAIKEGFEEFFERTEAFNQYSGRSAAAENVEIPNKDEPFFVKERPLDPYQLAFMKAAAHHSGWTCAQAPPGCGKTHTTSALVSYLNQMKVHGGVCISGTTNAAVTNAADAVKENFPEIHIVRNYSVMAQFGITKKSEEIALKTMAEDCDKHLDKKVARPVFQARKAHEKSVRRYTNTNFQKINAQANAYHKMKLTEKTLKNSFISHYNMNVYATTVELLIQGGDKFASGVVRDSEDYSEKAIKRIILDEAAQLSPTEALALYCRLPELTHITLLGDSYQLGPHSRIERGTDVYEFKTEGELTRMFKLSSTIKKSLNGLYRCHPLISEKVLIPIYGDMMEPRMTAEQRNLAALKGLPIAKDGSPIVMFNVQGAENKCSNEAEARAVVNFVIDMVIPPKKDGELREGVKEEDIVILVFHRQQKIKLEDMLHCKKQLSRKSGIRIETVDSFQGKEAKIVILCTTKAGGNKKAPEQKLHFIADPQRATVALSRAQHALYVFGDLELLAQSKFYAKIMKLLLARDGLMDTKMEPLNNVLKQKIRKTLNKTLGINAKDEIKERREMRRAKTELKKEKKGEPVTGEAVAEEGENATGKDVLAAPDENVVEKVAEETVEMALVKTLDTLTVDTKDETEDGAPLDVQEVVETSPIIKDLTEEQDNLEQTESSVSRQRTKRSKQVSPSSFYGSSVAPVVPAGSASPPSVRFALATINRIPSVPAKLESNVPDRNLIEL